jgi:DNA-binding IclR family transcriptional regulator
MATDTDSTGTGGIQVIARAARVLRALEGQHQGLSLSQLAKQTALPRSTIHRLLGALEAEGFVVPAPPNGRMRLGDELLRLGGSAKPDIQVIARPIMERLFRALGETVDLAVLEGDHLRFVDQIATPHRLRAVSSVGAVFPLHCTANGKAVLASMSDEDVVRLLPESLPRHTARTITSRRALLDELAVVRADGVALDCEEHTEGISAAGFALPTPSRTPSLYTAAITVPMPTTRFDEQREKLRGVLKEALREARAEFS